MMELEQLDQSAKRGEEKKKNKKRKSIALHTEQRVNKQNRVTELEWTTARRV